MVDLAIWTEGLTRRFGTGPGAKLALDDIDFAVETGEIHGLLGPNGAGKTTLTKILSTVLLPSSGQARVFGHDVQREDSIVRGEIGLMLGGDRGLYRELSASDNLRFWGSVYRVPRRTLVAGIPAALEQVGLSGVHAPVRAFSRGMQQRLHLARALVHRPRLLLLDEPTMGLDPAAALAFRDLVRALQARGTTILLTTHDMAEAEALCGRVTFLDGGRIRASERVTSLRSMLERFEEIRASVSPDDKARLAAEARSWTGIYEVIETAEGITIRTDRAGAGASAVRHLLDAGITRVNVSEASLHDVYLQLIGERGWSV